MIVLTADEAEKVRGLSPAKGGHALDPAPLKDGRFILGEEVLDDPAHGDVRDFLASLPREPLEKLPLFGPDDTLTEAVTQDRASRLIRRLPDHSLDEAKPDAPAPIDDDRMPRKP